MLVVLETEGRGEARLGCFVMIQVIHLLQLNQSFLCYWLVTLGELCHLRKGKTMLVKNRNLIYINMNESKLS